jgi:hypothetical protein
MLFLNPWLLMALAGISIPVIVHLVRRQAAKPVDWGAMRFLMDTLSERRRRMEWEDLLLMAARCLLLALAALAVARPFVPPDAPVPWALVLPAFLLGVGLFGGSFVLAAARKRLLVRAAAIAMLCIAAGMILMEHWLNLRRFQTGGSRDVAIVIDASTSMTRVSGSRTLFDEALDEARRIVKDSPRGTSFAVILGGPSPQALSNTPVSHRADVLAQLDGLRAHGGTFSAHDALGMATLVLAEGERPNKDIVVLTDSQRPGWRFDNAGAWKSLDEAWQTLPAKPRLLVRSFPQSPALRNAGISTIATPRALIGTDRPCLLRIEIANTGSETVTPGEMTLEVDGKTVAREPLGMLVPGQTQTVETRHRFTKPGPHVVTARLSGQDEIAGDNRADRVVVVRETVEVLLIDGNPAGSFFERAAGHTALALAPAAALLRGGEAGGDFLMDPVVIAAPDLATDDLAGADVIVLADVARLPAALAAAVADRTAAGAGLLVIAGPRAEPEFYNAMDGPDGPLMPLELGAEATTEAGVSPAPATFRHEALAWAADESRSDLGAAAVRRWRRSTMRSDGGSLAAAFSNGDVFLATRGYGRGRCAIATCAFDARAGNLPGRAAFVPLVHEIAAWCAGGGVDWNLDPSWNPSVVLDSRSSGGLAARYHAKRNRKQTVMERVDPAIHFDWANEAPAKKMPRDEFSIEWKATLLPQVSGEYIFDAEVDDRLLVRIDGKEVLDQMEGRESKTGRIRLEAGKAVSFDARYEEHGGLAFVRLFWTPPGGARQPVPSSAFIPAGDESAGSAIDPRGQTRKAAVSIGRRGRELRIDGPAMPGLYQVKLSADLMESLGPNTGSLPVVVRGDIGESRIDPLTDDDIAQLRAHADVIFAGSTEDVTAVLSGRGFGREITRTVAIAALILLILETALARWVSRSRRVGDQVRVEFGDTGPVAFGKGGWR